MKLVLFVVVSIMMFGFFVSRQTKHPDELKSTKNHEIVRDFESWFGYLSGGPSRAQMWWQTLILENGCVRMAIYTVADGTDRSPDQFSTKPNGQGFVVVRGRKFSIPTANALCIVELSHGLTEIPVYGKFTHDEWHALCNTAVFSLPDDQLVAELARITK